MQRKASERRVRRLKGSAPASVVPGIVALVVLLALGSLSGASAVKPSSARPSGAAASTFISIPHVTGAKVASHQESLTLGSPGLLNLFVMANGGNSSSTPFSAGNLVTATDHLGYSTAALAMTQESSDSFTTSNQYYRIGGVGISGFQYYGELTQVLIPPVASNSTVTVNVVLPEPALVVVVGSSGGQNNVITLGGIPGLSIDAKGSDGNWTGIMIGQAQLNASTYNFTLTEAQPRTSGEVSRGDLLGIFAFSASSAGFIDKQVFSVVSTISMQSNPFAAAYDSGKREIYVAEFGSNNVSVVSDATDSIVATVSVASGTTPTMPIDVVYDSGAGEIFVANWNHATVSVINDTTNSVVATLPVGYGSEAMTYDRGMGEIFVANGGNNTVSVLSDSTNAVVATIPVGNFPDGAAYDAAKGEVFVTNWGTSNVSVISDATNKVVLSIAVGRNPKGVADDSGKGEIFVANLYPNNVTIINDTTDKVVANVLVGSHPFSSNLAYDNATGRIFVPNSGSGDVSVISDATNLVVAVVLLGNGPYGTTFDSGNGEVFVVNHLSGTMSVIAGAG
jgi:YVTN family beta-propeller protein